MTKLINSLQAWGSKQFKPTLKKELEALNPDILPLEQATCQGGQVDASNIAALINSSIENDTHIQTQVGIFFNEVTAGCNCNDAPQIDNTYCDLQVSIDKITADTQFIIQKS
jgi:hypothetical protein